MRWSNDRRRAGDVRRRSSAARSEEHTSELQSQSNLVCRLLLEKKNHGYLFLDGNGNLLFRFYLLSPCRLPSCCRLPAICLLSACYLPAICLFRAVYLLFACLFGLSGLSI